MILPPPCRLATADDAVELQRFMAKHGGIDLPVDAWRDCFPYWTVATVDGVIAGACCVGLAKPIAMIEFLGLDRTLPTPTQSRIFQELAIGAAIVTCKMFGAQAIACFSPDGLQDFHSLIEKRLKFKKVQAGHFMLSLI